MGWSTRSCWRPPSIAGVDEIYRVGGAQAVAALAYGTATIAPVDKIVGPGNAYVAEAKRQVFGRVGIDMIAGPSEILIVAQAVVDPDWVAADLLSQAEHDERAQAILITDDRGFAERVMAAVEAQLVRLDRGGIAAASWRAHGAVGGGRPDRGRGGPGGCPGTGASRADRPGCGGAGPRDPACRLDLPRAAHARGHRRLCRRAQPCPADRRARRRFASGLAVHDFLKRTTLLGCDPASFARLGPAAAALARAEGLEAHARAVERRLEAMP